jgi:hypothetical protein
MLRSRLGRASRPRPLLPRHCFPGDQPALVVLPSAPGGCESADPGIPGHTPATQTDLWIYGRGLSLLGKGAETGLASHVGWPLSTVPWGKRVC